MAAAVVALAAAGAFAQGSPTQVSAGDNHTLALREDGTVLAWGSDRYGQLGLGRTVIATSPTRVSGVTMRTAPNSLAAGESHFIVVQPDGSVWTWGSNRNGQLGDGSTADSPTPIRVQGLPSNIVAVAAGGDHSMALTGEGNVYAWGNNQYGELGDGSTTQRRSPIQVPGLANVASIAIGSFHAAAIKRDGTLWMWGNNQFGQLGDGTTQERHSPAQVASLGTTNAKAALGDWHTLVIRTDATVWACGLNSQGQLGDGTLINRNAPVQVPGLHAVSVAASGLIGTSPGFHTSAAIATDGTLYLWGGYSQATHLPRQDQAFPGGGVEVSAGEVHVMIRRNDGSVWTTGSNAASQLGYPTAGGSTPSAQVPGVGNAIAVASYGQASAAALSDGTILTWGSNSDGQIGVPTVLSRPVPSAIPGLSNVVQIFAGGTDRAYAGFSMALKRDGTVWAWGSNFMGQLGRGPSSTTFASSPAPVSGLTDVQAISAGGTFALAVRRDGTVWVWGNGGLGVGAAFIGSPTGVPTQVPGLSNIKEVRAGKTFAFASRADGTWYGWGDNRFGQLGFVSTESCLDNDGTSHPCTTVPTPVPALFGFRNIEAGSRHSAGLKVDGTVWAWGDNTFGELGDGTFASRAAPAQVPNLSNVIGVGVSGNEVDPGGYSIAGLRDGSIWTWGANKFGQLGDGTRSDRSTPIQVLAIGTLAGGSAGNRHMDIVLADGSVVAWGANYYGQLGDGTFTIRTRPVMVVPENGTGDISTNNWFLDLAPSVSKVIPPDRIPAFLATATGDTNTASVTLGATVKFRASDIGKPIRIFAIAPTTLLKSEGQPKDGGSCALAQVGPDGTLHSATAGTLQNYVNGVINTQGQAINILTSTPNNNVAGATFCVGVGATGSESTAQQNNQCVATVPGDVNCVPSALAANTPDALSGLWWNAAESGWGIHFTQRNNLIFAAWYTYNASGGPKWYVSTCAMPRGTTGTSGTCNGAIYEVSGPTFFGTTFNPQLANAVQNGTLQVTFQNAGTASMTYSGVSGQTRTVELTRQPLATGTTAPAINYTDIWWAGASESGWGIAITQQFSTVFLAWYVYDSTGKPMWYVATCTLNGTSCSGDLLRTTGPAFGPAFNSSQVQAFTAGTVSVNFNDGNNATLNYTVNGVNASKTITRQLF